MGQLEELSTVGNVHKTEISALKIQVDTLKEGLQGARYKMKRIEESRDAERMEFETAAQGLMDARHQAERALSDKQSELAQLMRQLDERSTLAHTQKVDIIALQTQVEAMKQTLDGCRDELNAVEDRRDAERMELKAVTQKLIESRREAERALSDKDSELAGLSAKFEERSALADAQKAEISVLKADIKTLKEALALAKAEVKALKDCNGAERSEFEDAAEELIKERGEFEEFKRRVAELVQQLMAQTAEDKTRTDDLENRLVEQSRLLDESVVELTHLRGEIEIACKAEADLRNTIIEIEGRANTAIQNLKEETAKLQAALDRANGERMRLAHEVAKLKRQAEETWAA
jgi:chromosome segregation ATPase